MNSQENNSAAFIPTITIKSIEKNISKTYTDTEKNIETLEKIAKITNRSFNDVLKSIVINFLENGRIYDADSGNYIPIKKIDDFLKEKE